MRIARAILASLLGAALALGLYLTWFFGITHHTTPWDGASAGFVVVTGIFAAVCGVAGGYLATLISPETRRGTAEGAAGFILLAGIFADANTPGQHHFAQLLAILVAAPAAYLVGRAQPAHSVHAKRA